MPETGLPPPDPITVLLQTVTRLEVKMEQAKEDRQDILNRWEQIRQDLHAIRNELTRGLALIQVHEKVLADFQARLNENDVQLHEHEVAIAEAKGAKGMAMWAIGLMVSVVAVLMTYLGIKFTAH